VRRLAAALLTSVLLAAPAVAQRDTPLATGAAAPQFTLTDQHGRSFTLSEVIGAHEFVVLAFYVKAFTGG